MSLMVGEGKFRPPKFIDRSFWNQIYEKNIGSTINFSLLANNTTNRWLYNKKYEQELQLGTTGKPEDCRPNIFRKPVNVCVKSLAVGVYIVLLIQ